MFHARRSPLLEERRDSLTPQFLPAVATQFGNDLPPEMGLARVGIDRGGIERTGTRLEAIPIGPDKTSAIFEWKSRMNLLMKQARPFDRACNTESDAGLRRHFQDELH